MPYYCDALQTRKKILHNIWRGRKIFCSKCKEHGRLYNLLWVYNPARIVIDSCDSQYSSIMTKHFSEYMEAMKNDAIPIHTITSQAKYDEYHTMRGCFTMARNAWMEKIAGELI